MPAGSARRCCSGPARLSISPSGCAAKAPRSGKPSPSSAGFIFAASWRTRRHSPRRLPAFPGAFVITSGLGLVPPETVVTVDHLRQIAAVPIDAGEPRYREPLERGCRTLVELAGEDCDFILLGSVATVKYLAPMVGVFGERLLFPEEFIGRGDMSRGGLMLRCARAGQELTYGPLGLMTRHGKRPPKLPETPLS